MARLLKMAKIQAIRGLHERRWSNRRIARELEVDRETVAKYVRPSRCAPKPAKAPIGSDMAGGQATEGGERALAARAASEEPGIEASLVVALLDAAAGVSKPAKAPIGSEALLGTGDPAQTPIGSDSKPAQTPIGSETLWREGNGTMSRSFTNSGSLHGPPPRPPRQPKPRPGPGRATHCPCCTS
jgi:hypothetical protein